MKESSQSCKVQAVVRCELKQKDCSKSLNFDRDRRKLSCCGRVVAQANLLHDVFAEKDTFGVHACGESVERKGCSGLEVAALGYNTDDGLDPEIYADLDEGYCSKLIGSH